jgi:hypothetical protein
MMSKTFRANKARDIRERVARMSDDDLADRYYTISAALEPRPMPVNPPDPLVLTPTGYFVLPRRLSALIEPRAFVKLRMEDGSEI